MPTLIIVMIVVYVPTCGGAVAGENSSLVITGRKRVKDDALNASSDQGRERAGARRVAWLEVI